MARVSKQTKIKLERLAMYRICQLPVTQCEKDYGWKPKSAWKLVQDHAPLLRRIEHILYEKVAGRFKSEHMMLLMGLMKRAKVALEQIEQVQNGEIELSQQHMSLNKELLNMAKGLLKEGFTPLEEDRYVEMEELEEDKEFEKTTKLLGIDKKLPPPPEA